MFGEEYNSDEDKMEKEERKEDKSGRWRREIKRVRKKEEDKIQRRKLL
jgi:hypothetical protein